MQDDIEKWFDSTYKARGFRYLRPKEAYKLFGTMLSPQVGSRHLDIACGPGLLLKCLHELGSQTYGIDLSTEAIAMAKKYTPESDVQTANAEAIPYPNNYFDSITCIGSLERMLDRNKVLHEMLRVGESNATYCLMVRNSENFTWKYLWKPLGLINRQGHQDALNLKDWIRLFESNGFSVQRIYPDHWPFYRLLKTFLPWKNIDYSKIRRFRGNLKLAYEFIFILKKR